jgi:hypothetical protein
MANLAGNRDKNEKLPDEEVPEDVEISTVLQ